MKEVHLICNAHIDPIWQWDWQEGVSAVLSTFKSAAELAEKYDYIFCHNEVTVYKYVEEYAPELFEKIKKLVKSGKWIIMGGWYLQPDCNMPSGESFVRQINVGKMYFKEKFGVEPSVATNLDPFGHTQGLVQILKKCGYNGYLFMRPYKYELELPSEQFLWKGLDGSEIKAVRTGSYNTPLGNAAGAIEQKAADAMGEVVCALWGVGNHGGGPSEKDIKDIDEMMKNAADKKYIHSFPENFFDKIEPKNVFDKSLRISMPGCYTSMRKVKRKHAELESELSLAEIMLTVAYNNKKLNEYPHKEIREIEEDLLNAEFHDVLPGSCVKCGEDNGLKLLDHGLLNAERLKTKAFFALMKEQAPAKDGEFPIVVFNPNHYKTRENIECEFSLADQNWNEKNVSSVKVYDESGKEIKAQVIKEESNINLDWRKKIIFEAELKPLQLNRFSVFIEYKEKPERKKSTALLFNDGRKRVEIDGKTGLLKSYSIDGVEYIKDGLRLYSFDDNADPWGMGLSQLKRLGENGQPFDLSEKPSGVFAGMKNVQIVEDGEIYTGVEAFFEKDNSRARILYKIYKNSDFIDVDVNLFFGDANKIIKLEVPVSLNGRLIGQTAFGSEELFMDARENVSQRFIAIEDGEKCVAVMNDGIYGSHYENGNIFLSLVRGVTYCAHPIEDRQLLPDGRFTKKIDQGENDYSFRIGLIKRSELERKTQEFIRKPYALNVFPTGTGKNCIVKFDFSMDDEVISLVTAKQSVNGEKLIFRLLNNTENEVTTAACFCGKELALRFVKNEVKTLVFENGNLYESYELII